MSTSISIHPRLTFGRLWNIFQRRVSSKLAKSLEGLGRTLGKKTETALRRSESDEVGGIIWLDGKYDNGIASPYTPPSADEELSL